LGTLSGLKGHHDYASGAHGDALSLRFAFRHKLRAQYDLPAPGTPNRTHSDAQIHKPAILNDLDNSARVKLRR
jgi:hypothetical protein